MGRQTDGPGQIGRRATLLEVVRAQIGAKAHWDRPVRPQPIAAQRAVVGHDPAMGTLGTSAGRGDHRGDDVVRDLRLISEPLAIGTKADHPGLGPVPEMRPGPRPSNRGRNHRGWRPKHGLRDIAGKCSAGSSNQVVQWPDCAFGRDCDMVMGAHQRFACLMVGVETAGRQDHALFRPDLPALAGDANNLSPFSQHPFHRPFGQNNATPLPDRHGQLRHDDIAIGQPCAARPT